MAASARLGVAPPRLVAEGHRGSVGRQLRRRLPVDQAGAREGRGGAAHAAPPRRPRQVDGRAARPDPGVVGARGRDVWIPRRRVDGQPRRGGDLAHLWCPLSPRSGQPLVAPGGLESPAAYRAGHAARRAGHCAVVCRALASAPKKAAEEGSTIVWGDEAGFYLLPLAVRTWAPRGQTPILHVPLPHDHLAAISGITLDGRLDLQTRKDAFNAEGVVGFLRVRHAQAARQGPGHLGRIADPQGAADQGFPHARRGEAPPPGTLARLRARPQSGRGDLELAQARRAQEPLLPRPGRTQPGAAPRQRALALQARPHPGLFGPLWLLGLANDAEVSKSAPVSSTPALQRRDPRSLPAIPRRSHRFLWPRMVRLRPTHVTCWSARGRVAERAEA